MPASGQVKHDPMAEMPEVTPVTYIKGAAQTNVFCTSVEERTGITPGRCLIQVGGNTIDVNGPITLNAHGWDRIKKGARIQTKVGGKTDFLGALRRRHDQGQPDNIVWEGWDDRWLLSKIPILGCLVYDREASNVKFLTRYLCRTNPNGWRNCVGADMGSYGIQPVFSHVAEVNDDEKVNEPVGNKLEVGVLRSWTPHLFLQNLCLICKILRGSVPGTDIPAWRSLATSTRLEWNFDSLNFAPGTDMDHKMPDISFAGMKILGAIGKTLACVKTYGLRVGYRDEKSFISFYSKDRNSPNKKDIYVQRGGEANDINTAYDFEMDEDGSELAESVVALGATNRGEGQIEYTGDNNSTLDKGWSDAIDYAARKCLNGGDDDGAPHKYCLFPKTINDTTNDFLVADGSTPGRPKVLTNTSDAVTFVRQHYPQFMRAFKVRSDRLATTLLKGSDDRFANANAFPVLTTPRPVLEHQLTYILDDNNKQLKQRWPIRVQIGDKQAPDANPKFHDCTAESGVFVGPDALIYLPGLTDENSARDLLYTGSLRGKPFAARLKPIRMNVAMPLDSRIMGYAEAKGDLDSDLDRELGGPFEDIIDAPDAWRFEDRVNSSPFASIEYKGTDGTTSFPVTKKLLDENDQADAHAYQHLNVSMRSKYNSSWKLIGIRPDYKAGDFIGKIKVVHGGANDSDYILDAPLDLVTRDYSNQITIAGGIASQSRAPAPGGNTAVSERVGAPQGSVSSGSGLKPASSSYSSESSSSQSSDSPSTGSQKPASSASGGDSQAAPRPETGRRSAAAGDEGDAGGAGAGGEGGRRGQILSGDELARKDEVLRNFGNEDKGIMSPESTRAGDDEMKGRYYGKGQDGAARGQTDFQDHTNGAITEDRETPQERRRRIVGGG